MYVLQDVQCLSGLRIVVFYVTNVFAVPKCQVLPVCPMYALLHVSHVSLYMPLLSWSCVVSWFFGFGQLLQCVCTFKRCYTSLCVKNYIKYVAKF